MNTTPILKKGDRIGLKDGTIAEVEYVRWSSKRACHLFYLKRLAEPDSPRDSLGVPVNGWPYKYEDLIGTTLIAK